MRRGRHGRRRNRERRLDPARRRLEAKALVAPENLSRITGLLDSPERFDLLAADMGGLVRENRRLLTAYRDGFT
jgi:hypothetical protein